MRRLGGDQGDHLGGNLNNIGTNHLSTSDVFISFAPPKLSQDNVSRKATVVGLIQNLSLSQQRQILKFFEYGNEEYQMVAGKPRHNLSINRALFDGPSILKYIGYAYSESDQRGSPLFYRELMEDLGYTDGSNVRDVPGTSDFWLNLASELFENPIGIFVNVKQTMPNGRKVDYGGVFLENCLVSNHNISFSVDSRLLVEQLTMEVGRPIPLTHYGGDNIAQIETIFEERFGPVY